jgi:hypothetical protein
MAEKGMIVENPLELLPLFEGMQLLPDASLFPPASMSKEESQMAVPEGQTPTPVHIEAGVEPQSSETPASRTSADEPKSETPQTQPALPDSVEPAPAVAETWILNVWVDESKKHWPEEFRTPMTALLSAIKMQGQAVPMEKVQVLNPFVFTDRHGIKEWALTIKPKSILIWANQTNLDDVPAVFEQTQWEGIPVYRLPAFSKVAANVDNKREAWAKLKGFYNF